MKKKIKGLSLIEIVVVMGLFAILGVLSTRAVLLSLAGGKKGDSLVKVRDNVDYAMNVIERGLRNADSVSPCPNSDDTTRIDYADSAGIQAHFSCVNIGPGGYIASGSANLRITNTEVAVTSCSFICQAGSASAPPQIEIDITAQDVNAPSGNTGSSITVSEQIDLRTY